MKHLDVVLQFSAATAGIITRHPHARNICDAYIENAGRRRRDGVLAAWLVDPATGEVCYGSPPENWRTWKLYENAG